VPSDEFRQAPPATGDHKAFPAWMGLAGAAGKVLMEQEYEEATEILRALTPRDLDAITFFSGWLAGTLRRIYFEE